MACTKAFQGSPESRSPHLDLAPRVTMTSLAPLASPNSMTLTRVRASSVQISGKEPQALTKQRTGQRGPALSLQFLALGKTLGRTPREAKATYQQWNPFQHLTTIRLPWGRTELTIPLTHPSHTSLHFTNPAPFHHLSCHVFNICLVYVTSLYYSEFP